VCFIFLLIQVNLPGQSRYEVHKLPFSSPDYDEFCPFVWGDTLIFCSNQGDEFLLTYHDGRNKGLFNIFKVRIDPQGVDMKPSVLSRALITHFNDGPAALSPDGQQIVYSRNQEVNAKRKNVYELSNHLGLYFAEFEKGDWVPKGEFPYNHPKYSITAPCYSSDGRFLYFASDHPEGYGGRDLYRSERKGEVWGEPINLGPEINTSGNEAYPFIAANGDLFFASDGHAGLGGKDIFLSRYDDGQWMSPIHLDYPLNSEEDDFGLVTNGDFSEGFLSTNREKSDDIYRFYTHIPQLTNCEAMRTNNYCCEFWDEEYPGVDSLPVIYEWSFSDGTRKRGLRVTHCFPGAGSHWARLNIIDDRTDSTFYTQSSLEFELTDLEQPFITSNEIGEVDVPMVFSGMYSNMPGFVIEQYIWDFGDGGFAEGPEVEHVYENSGFFEVRLGLKGYLEGGSQMHISCVQKTVEILSDRQAHSRNMAAHTDNTGSNQ
jgi:hypothetical protein